MSDIFDALHQSGSDPRPSKLPLHDEAFASLGRPERSPDLGPDSLSLSGLSEFEVGAKEDLRSIQVHIKSQTPLLPFAGENSHAAEQYRIIRTRILQHAQQPRTLAISSAESGDGKSVNAVNLAGVMALNPEEQIVLVDADLHRGSLARYFDVPVKPGLADVLSGTAALSDCIARIEPFPNLFFLPSGKGRGGPADLLNSKRWDNVSAALRQQFSYVIYDTPPAGAVADFDLIQANCDGVILVVRQDHTNRMLWMRAYESVPPKKLIGVVMNCVKPWFLGRGLGYYQYYNYSKYYRRG
ncbi:MAG: polysaccharide biosynthesis tyrosine autokinase [Acidobacteria bacterium]|nr:polysaccharide biosynthesis tyrosine autokinase [Acidobacteriota bacterium]